MAKQNDSISPIPFLLLFVLILSMFIFNIQSIGVALAEGSVDKLLCEMKPGGFKYLSSSVQQPKFLSQKEYHCVDPKSIPSTTLHGVCAPHSSCVN